MELHHSTLDVRCSIFKMFLGILRYFKELLYGVNSLKTKPFTSCKNTKFWTDLKACDQCCHRTG
jgi:hypothetical protein